MTILPSSPSGLFACSDMDWDSLNDLFLTLWLDSLFLMETRIRIILTQWVSEATHLKGHSLDLVISYAQDICIKSNDNVGISDHFLFMVDAEYNAIELTSAGPHRPVCIFNSETVPFLILIARTLSLLLRDQSLSRKVRFGFLSCLWAIFKSFYNKNSIS